MTAEAIGPGRHIRVRRHVRVLGFPYSHHGIVVGDDVVIEFGGANLWTKGQTRVRRVSFGTFSQDGTPQEVVHPITWSGLTYSPLLPSEHVVHRAEWLLYKQPPPYRLGYRNCESIAIWCATGDYETFQVKRYMRWRVLISLLVFVVWRKMPVLGLVLGLVGVVSTLVTAIPYTFGRGFFDHTRNYPGVPSTPAA
jgi:hypothetical protein